MPARDELPSTLQRSPKKAQDTWSEAHDSAVEQYGEGERAHRTAFAALKHSFEKVGDRWEPKSRKGPSDPQAAEGGRKARRSTSRTYGGVDVEGRTKDQLLEHARRLGVRGRSSMTKDELGTAIAKANDRATARARDET